MAKNLNPKCKQCRREGDKLFLKGDRCNTVKCAMVKRSYAPGVHGPKKQRRGGTEYGKQLREKQKAKRIYGILETQFSNYFKEARKRKGNTGENLFQILESRLDNVVYRLGLAVSRGQAKQLVGHGHFLIDGRKVNIPSFFLKEGNKIAVRIKGDKKNKYFEELKKRVQSKQAELMPSWLTFDFKEMTGAVIGKPAPEEKEQLINSKLILEYYSRAL